MMNSRRARAIQLTLALLSVSAIAYGAVIRLSLAQMVSHEHPAPVHADDAMLGTIKNTHSRFVKTKDGVFEFTDITVEGESLFDGHHKTVTASFIGGPNMVTTTMPPLEMTRRGNRVVMFSAYADTMGGVAMNSLVCGFGGLFQVARNAGGEDVVIGQGIGCAIESTITVDQLKHEIADLRR